MAKRSSRKASQQNGNATLSAYTPEEVLHDYRIAAISRQASLLGRREVLTGKAKFGIFGDGKEVAQVAMARAFRKGDWRSGYYRDQTFMFAIGESSVQKFFAQLYAHTSIEHEPASAGRSMNGHFATRFIDGQGAWVSQVDHYNVSADVSPTGSQMPRLVGLAYASVLYREVEELKSFTAYSNSGREVAFGTIGNASAAEGMFWEAINAMGVLNAPVVMSIWDDGYGISVPNSFQHTKADVGKLLAGFAREEGGDSGYHIRRVEGYDYEALREAYERAAEEARTQHIPQIIHVVDVTQPQGHSTSGSHERYKSKERLQWEVEFDCITRMRQWMVANGYATDAEMDAIDAEATLAAAEAKQAAWDAYITPIRAELEQAAQLIAATGQQQTASDLLGIREPFRKDAMVAVARALEATYGNNTPERKALLQWRRDYDAQIRPLYADHLHAAYNYGSNASYASAQAPYIVPPLYTDQSKSVNGSEVLNACFDVSLARDPRIVAFGEDLGALGDVNQGFAGLQAKYGALRVSDTGIRETTIVGQAIGLAMRGLRPIAEVQYLDYLLYALQIMSDDLATVEWRTRGGQRAPAIIRTRGHRLEGVWHSGSQMAGVINLVRGVNVCVPRNMTQAAGMYNTLLREEQPALVIEVLNGYRLKERLPDNVGEFMVPLGVPEFVRHGGQGAQATLVTYGACVRVALDAAERLAALGVEIDVIDVQTLLPFDTEGVIATRVKETNRLVVLDEDVPGGASAYILQKLIERDKLWWHLDEPPITITATEHRPAYGTDGSYWSKPEAEDVIGAVLGT
jgi:pyruvate/2-oxoglutarate/acetoin dehydrogenase E1 component/TPP-dependent pyruvate/acetoin dehydrogenase alpha subunit